MNSQKQFASTQEEIVHGLAALVLGTPKLFCPDDFGHSKEPADIAWVENKCAILMYLTESKGSFEKKKKHNVRQLNKWLKVWMNGQPLTGTSSAGPLTFLFQDVDHVVGLSVIDGGEKWCEYHPEQVMTSAGRKLSACATVTGPVIRLLAEIGSTPRDILYWVTWLQSAGQPIPEDRMLQVIRSERDAVIRHIKAKLRTHLKAGIDYSWSGDLVRNSFDILKNRADTAESLGIVADLRFSDIYWMSLTIAVLDRTIAPPGQVGPLLSRAQRTSGLYTLTCASCAHGGILSEKLDEVLTSGPGLALMSTLQFGVDAPSRMMAFEPLKGASMLEQAADAIRFKTMPKPGFQTSAP